MHRGLPRWLVLYYISIPPSLGHDPTISISWTRLPIHHLSAWRHILQLIHRFAIIPKWYAIMQCMLKSNKHNKDIYKHYKTSNMSSRWRVTKRWRFDSHPLLATYLGVTIITQPSKTTICILNIQVKAYHNMSRTLLLTKHIFCLVII